MSKAMKSRCGFTYFSAAHMDWSTYFLLYLNSTLAWQKINPDIQSHFVSTFHGKSRKMCAFVYYYTQERYYYLKFKGQTKNTHLKNIEDFNVIEMIYMLNSVKLYVIFNNLNSSSAILQFIYDVVCK